jgi:ribonuclease E
MSKKIMLINADQPEECRVVILEDGKIEELIVEHASHEQIKGNIYLGTINRVEPSIEAAFLDIGSKKFGFLPFKDVRKDSYLQTGEKKARTRIQDVLVRGQNLLVQVVKEGRDAKGPSLTNWISLPGRFLVLMVGQEASAVSRKIEDESERKKLKDIIADFNLPDNMGVIIRTAGLGRTKLELQKDLQMLLNIWEKLDADLNSEDAQAPALLYSEPDMVVRTVRDHFTADTTEIIVDDKESYKAVQGFVKMVMPRLYRRVKFHKETKPIFSQFNIETQIDSIYDRTVKLPSGGSIVIDIGEAMVSIDVNSGKTTGASQLEETATNTNMEAATEVGRQLRLRDLGGLIVIDFIDMYQKKNKALVEKQLKLVCKKDKARINLSRISKFGLMEMSRQRMSPPVKEGVFEACKVCKGAGNVKSVGNIVLGMLRRIQEIIARDNVRLLAVEVSPEVGDYMLTHKLRYLLELQEKHHFIIEFVSKPGLAHEDFIYNVLERKKPGENEQEEKQTEASPSTRSENAISEQTSEDGTDDKRESSRGRPRNQRGKSSSRRRSPRVRRNPDEIKSPDKPEETDQVAQNGNTKVEPAGEAIVETQKEGDAEIPKEGGAETPKEGDAETSKDSRPKSAPRKRYTRRKTSSKRSSNYRGRRKPAESTQSSETASPGGDQAKPEVDGNVAPPRTASQEASRNPESENVSPPTPITAPTAPSDPSPAKEPPPQSFPDDSSL